MTWTEQTILLTSILRARKLTSIDYVNGFMATISYLRLLETMSGGDYHVFTMSRPVVPMSVPTSAFFSLHKNNERISIKFEQVGPTYHQQMNRLYFGWNCTINKGDKIQIDVKPWQFIIAKKLSCRKEAAPCCCCWKILQSLKVTQGHSNLQRWVRRV